MKAAVQQKHIAIVINTMCCGGAERFVESAATELLRCGVRVTVIVFTLDKSHFQLDPGVHVIGLGRRSPWNVVRTAMRLRSTLLRLRPDAVLSVMSSVTFQTVLALIGLRHFRLYARECVCHAQILRGINRLAHVLLLPLCLRACRAVICQSEGMRQDLARVFHVPLAKTVVINNPINIRRCQQEATAPVNHPWLGRATGYVAVTCAGLSAFKDYPTLLQAMALLNQQCRCNLIVLGDGALRAQLVRLRDQLGLQTKVDFIGAVPNPFPYYAAADLFVLSSHTEAFPNVILEAMTCTTPVISTDCPWGPREIIRHGHTGLLVPPHDPAAMAAAMLQLLSDRPRARAMAAAALNDVQQRFALDQIMQRYCALLLGS